MYGIACPDILLDPSLPPVLMETNKGPAVQPRTESHASRAAWLASPTCARCSRLPLPLTFKVRGRPPDRNRRRPKGPRLRVPRLLNSCSGRRPRQFRAKPLMRRARDWRCRHRAGQRVKHHLITATFLLSMACGRRPVGHHGSSHVLPGLQCCLRLPKANTDRFASVTVRQHVQAGESG